MSYFVIRDKSNLIVATFFDLSVAWLFSFGINFCSFYYGNPFSVIFIGEGIVFNVKTSFDEFWVDILLGVAFLFS